jgi:acetyltransferase-like isoleucine patch superfamily enzyme
MAIANDVKLGKNVKIPYPDMVNLYGCELGNNVFVGPFVEIQKGVKIGSGSRISSHTFICEGVSIGKKVFVAHGVMFINDKFSDSKNLKDWKMRKTIIEDNVRIGSNATLLPVKIGRGCIIGAGAVVVKNVPEKSIVVGNPGKVIRKFEKIKK